MREGAEEVGHVAAVVQKLVLDLAQFGRDFRAIEAADAWHAYRLHYVHDDTFCGARCALTRPSAFAITDGEQPSGCQRLPTRS